MIRSWIAPALAALFLSAQPSTKGGPLIEWQQTNGPYGGGTRGLLFHQGQLLVPAEGGVWRSLDGGRSWLALGGRFEQGWGIVQFGPDLLMSYSNGIYRTADLGRSWSECAAIPRTRRTDRILVAAGERLYHWNPDSGLLRSLDRCATWTRVAVPWDCDPALVTFVFSPTTRSFFALTYRDWFRTKDDGASWEKISQPKPYLNVLTSAPASGSDLLLGTSHGLYRSSNDGISWTLLGFADKWVSRILVSRAGEIYAVVGGRTLMRSADDGRTWTPASEGLSGTALNGLAQDSAGTLYAADDTGVYRRDLSGKWLHVGLPTFFVSSLLAAPWGDVYASGGSLGLYRTTNQGRDWVPLLLPDNSADAMTVAANGDLLVGTSDSVYRSGDRGESWTRVGLQQRVSSLFAVPGSSIILAGTENGIFRSLDEGETWTERSIGLHHFAVSALGAGADGVLYAATLDVEGDGGDAEVYWSRDHGDHWRLFAPPIEGTVVTGLAVLPGPDVIAASEDGVFRWNAGGARWDLWRPRAAKVSSLVLHDGRVIVATMENGLFISHDRAHTWTHDLGLPTPRVRALAVDKNGDLYVATGKGDGDGRVYRPRGPVAIFRGRFVRKQ